MGCRIVRVSDAECDSCAVFHHDNQQFFFPLFHKSPLLMPGSQINLANSNCTRRRNLFKTLPTSCLAWAKQKKTPLDTEPFQLLAHAHRRHLADVRAIALELHYIWMRGDAFVSITCVSPLVNILIDFRNK